MKNHVWRPLYVAICIVGIVLLARTVLVPKDYGTHEQGYMYGTHRKGSVDEWKAVTVKYKGSEACKDCHGDRYAEIMGASHAAISCENCHGPLREHPENPAKLTVDRSRALCIRCHAKLPYAGSNRGSIPGIDPEKHNVDIECVTCHSPHKPTIPGAENPNREVKK